jgi:exosome complex RNA-binding protein Rrp42 (RNase PH superfamily)
VTVSQPQQQQQQQQSSASASSAAVDVSLLQSWLERTLEETLDLQQLILSNGNQAWSLQVQLQIINSRVGNLRDFCFLAALAAIHDTVFPETVVEMNNSNKQTTTYLKQQGDDLAEPAAKQRRFKLPIVPIPLTLGLWVTGAEPRWVVDLTRDEEEQCRGQLTLIVNAVSNKVLQCDWVSTQGIDPTMIAVGVHMAQARAKELKPEFGLE